jgi:hypothetical protein
MNKDTIFHRLNQMLGNDIDPENFDNLNYYIIYYYGKNLIENDAILKAEDTIKSINLYIEKVNSEQTWYPIIKYPLLNTQSDNRNYIKLKNILVKYNMTPRTISKDEFIKIKETFKT